MSSSQEFSAPFPNELLSNPEIAASGWTESLWQELETGSFSGVGEAGGRWEYLFTAEALEFLEIELADESHGPVADYSSFLTNIPDNTDAQRDFLTGLPQQVDWGQVVEVLRDYGSNQGYSASALTAIETLLVTEVQQLQETAATHLECALPFGIVAEGRIMINGNSDFDGDPLDATDDVLMYGGQGFTLNGQPVLPVQRDSAGNPIVDDQGRPVLVENAIAVSASYSTFNAPQNQYAGLVPPQIVDERTVEVPAHNDLVNQILDASVPDNAQIIDFNPNQNPLNNLQDWQQHFPPNGTVDNPTVVRLTGWGLNVPNQVNLENMVLIVEQGSVNFNGSGHRLNNVTLIAENGGINLSNVEATDVTVLASQQINMNGGATFAGQSFLASEQSVTFNGATTSGADRLKVVSQRDITFNGSSDTRAQFTAGGNFFFNGQSTLYGRINTKGDVFFNNQATVVAANDVPIVRADQVLTVAEDSAPTALNLQLPVDLDEDALTIQVIEIPDWSKGVIQRSDGTALFPGQQLTLADLQDLSFATRENANGEAGQFVYEVDDGWCSYARQVIDFNITPVNDAPVLTLSTESSVVEAGQALAIAAVSVADIDAAQGELVATLTVSNGLLQLAQVEGLTILEGDATAGAASLTISGTLADLNAALPTLTYTADSRYSGIETLTLTVDDQGNTGAGGPLTASAALDLEITPAGILLEEGSDFQVTAEELLTIPETPTVVSFTYTDFFDLVDPNAINDAFEVALLDSDGNSLVHPYGTQQDAFFNLTEGLPTALAAGVSVNGQTVTLDLSDIAAGTEARLVFRLVNNDGDTETSVRIQNIELLPGEDNGVLSVVPQVATNRPVQDINFSQLEDVSGWLTAEYGRTSFNDQTGELWVEVAAQNVAAYGVRDTLLMVVDSISDPSVSVVDADGLTPDGKAYFDLSALLGDNVLTSGETSEFFQLVFRNPNQVQFDYELTFLSELNDAPEFVSDPNLEALVGQPYRYDADAVDADGDTLSYSLLSGPEGLSIDGATGELVWNPAATDVGTQQLTIQVEDGLGGVDTQTYTLTVKAEVSNRPPVIVTPPVVNAEASKAEVSDQFDLLNWSVIQYDFGVHGFLGNWVINDDGTVAEQTLNADPSILLSDIDVVNQRIEGEFQVNTANDDDYVGFVFGYQNSANYYIFDWKQALQNSAPEGMSIRAITADSPLANEDFSAIGNGDRVRILYSNETGWEDFKTYQFTLDFTPGEFTITVRDGEEIVESVTIEDDTFTSGKFGFYNRSQNNVTYSGFKISPIPENVYTYDVDAIDPDQDEVTYGLLDAPDGMTIDPETGVIRWQPTIEHLKERPLEQDRNANLPTLQGFEASIYANVTDPTELTFAPDGTLYVGRDNSGSNGGFHDAVKVTRVGPRATTVTEYGSQAIDDPDTVLFDRYGQFSGTPSALLVGGINEALTDSRIRAILPDESVQTVFGFSPELGNITSLKIDTSGRLIFGNVHTGEVLTSDGGFPQVLFTIPGEIGSNIAIDQDNQIYVGDRNGTVRIYSSEGELVNDNFITGLQGTYNIQFAKGGIWGDSLYLTNSGKFYRVSDDGELTTVGDGFSQSAFLNFNFGPDQALYVTDFDNDQIIRISPTRESLGLLAGEHRVVVTASDSKGGVDTQEYVVKVTPPSDNNSPVIVSDPVTEVGLISTPNSTATGVYEYDADAVDLDNDVVSYSLVDAPQGMTIDPETGLIEWDDISIQEFTQPSLSETFFGETLNFTDEPGPPDAPIRPETLPEVDTAQKAFLEKLRDPKVESFESFAEGETPTTLTFGGDTATFRGSPSVRNFPEGTLNGAFPTSGDQFLFHFGPSGSFEIEFDTPQAAFGFKATDVGDGIGQLALTFHLVDGGTKEVVVPTTAQRSVNTGSALFFGIVDVTDPFTKVTFSNTNSLRDGFGFDEFTIGRAEQIILQSTDVTVRATDEYGAFDEQQYTLNIVGNSSPTITTPPILKAAVGEPYRYDVNSVDADGDILSYKFIEAPQDAVIDPQTGEIEWIPSTLGSYQFVVEVSDNRGGTDAQRFSVAVLDALTGNNAPVFEGAGRSEAIAGEVYRYDAVAVDLDGDSLSYDLVSSPDGMFVDSSSGTVIWQPSSAQLGTHDVILRVQDGNGGIDLQAFQVTVESANETPVINSTPAFTAIASLPYEYRIQAQDADGEVTGYRLISGPEGMTIDETTGVVRWTPTAGQTGVADVVVVAIDNDGAFSGQEFTVSVVAAAPNDAPEILSTPRTQTRIETLYFYQLQATDPNGDPLTYSVVDGPAGLTIDENGLVLWTPTAAQQGSNAVTLQVSDGRGEVLTQSFAIAVNDFALNTAPTITSDPASLGATVDRVYQYNAMATDPDGDVVLWQLLEAPTGMSVDAEAGTLRWQPGAEQLGNHIVILQAIDTQGAFTQQSFELTVRGTNLAPLITSIPLTSAAAEAAYTYQVNATDVDGDAPSYELVQGPSGMVIDAETGRIDWQPTADQVGFAEVVVAVNDARGAGTTQTYQIAIAAAVPNEAPAIVSQPTGFASVDSAYTYQVVATDPNGDTLTYELLDGPAGMTMDAATGVLSWQPDSSAIGSVTVTVGAVDPGGLGGAQRFTLQVVAGNDAPVVLSEPETIAFTGETYRYDLRAQDPNGDALSYELIDGPTGMTVDAQGRIHWNPTEAGTTDITVAVRDVYGATTTQSYSLTAAGDEVAPEVSVFPSLFPADVNQPLSVFVRATDNVGVVSRSLTIDGVAVLLTNGTFSFTPDQVGDFVAIATATDAAGNVSQAETVLQVRDFTTTGVAPTVALMPLNCQVFTSPTDIIGTVEDDNLVSYTLSLAALGTDNFREIYRGTDTVDNSVLGQLDTSLFQNDAYTLRLTAEDANGNVVFVDETVNIAGDLKLGNFTLSFTDMVLPVSGIPVAVTRTYDSLTVNETDDFGYGWRMEFRDTNLRTSLGPDEQYEQFGIRSQAFEQGTRVYLTLPGGQRQGFTFEPRQVQQIDGQPLGPFSKYFYEPVFTADDGVTSQLTLRYDGYLSQAANGDYIGFQGSGFNPADPLFGGVYVLTTKEGIEYEIDATTGDLLTAKDLNGNTVTFTDSGIYSDSGTQITFGRDAQGRITALNDPDGQQVVYEYDANGDLVSVTDREGNTTRFDYNDEFDHYLDEIIDPLGRSGVKSEYDEQGRLTRLLDVNGEAVELVYDPENSTQTVEDVFGNPTTYVYDDRGNVVTEVDAVGQVIQRSYDDDNNVLSETIITEESGPEGWTTTYTYDEQGNQLTMTDAEGHTTFYSYGANSRLLSETDALGNTTTYIYDSRGNLLTTTDAEGEASTFDYSQSGNLLSLDDALGNNTSFSYDPRGQVTRMTDAEGNVTQYEYDADGNRIKETRTVTTPTGVQELITRWTYDGENRVETMTDAAGGVTTYEYDANGNQTAVIDALGNRTEMRYDDRGQLIETIFADETPNDLSDNSRTLDLYDRGGRLRASIDQAGNVTHYVYDAVDRLIETIHPDEGETLQQLLNAIAPGETLETVDWTEVVYSDAPPAYLSDNDRVRTEYTQDGRVKASIDERGNRTEYRYDAVGRLIETIYADETPADLSDNPTMTVEYDAVGRRIAETDALGHTTRYEYDTLGRVIETTFHDGSSTQVSYDAAGRRESVTDQEGKVTEYLYDNVGRLAGVRDAMGFLTQYRYDEVGRLVAAEDAEGNITEYEYDQVGRRTAVELPLGQRAISTYDAAGNLVSYTDFNGEVTQFEYDARNRLILKDYEDDADVSYTYCNCGQLRGITDGRGETLFSYDARGRLVARTDPDGPYLPSGATIEYTYDEAGNRTAVTTPNGSVSYGYDERNRLTTVVDEDFNLTTYGYDDANNLTRTEFPNGVVETREYDDLNRLVVLENKAGDTVISSYRYELNAAGHRLSVTEDDGRQVSYTYDDLYRLTEENINNGERVISYTFDNVGNRLTQDDSVEGVTTYTYDNNDRLQTETLSQNGTVIDTIIYTYDDNGNLIQQVKNDTETTTYTWNDDNRLVAVTTPEGNSVTYEYDDSGIRVSSTVNSETTDYLIDKNRAYAQVLEEFVNDELAVSYVYGHDLISQTRTEDTSYYQVDGLGSTRVLTDESGTISDNYDYDAFGNLIESSGVTENSYQYAGEQFDENLDNYYLRQRFYDQGVGRLTTRDTYEGRLEEPLTLHKYLYTHANPINATDPSGLFTLTDISTARKVRDTLAEIQFSTYVELIRNTDPDGLGGEAAGFIDRIFGFIQGIQILKSFYVNVDPLLSGNDLSVFGASNNRTRRGIRRNNPRDWKTWMQNWDSDGYGDILSQENRKRIAARQVPIVDDDWIRTFPGDTPLKGEAISIHHIDGSSINVPLPRSRHKDAHMPGGYRYNPGGPGQTG
ncbi:MAG: tandem-95 repeat protein [Leptolyngbya sp. SIOISBB]|nr:tandem-95 repeat protein [Leptolyngbya sp. SIOISBB]